MNEWMNERIIDLMNEEKLLKMTVSKCTSLNEITRTNIRTVGQEQ